MKNLRPLLPLIIAMVVCSCQAPRHPTDNPNPLFTTIAALDTEVFAAFNQCDDPAQLQKHAAYFASDVEFYHDTGGVTWSREAMLENTQKHVCGKFRRALIPNSLKVFPIKDFGAIAQGAHRFCTVSSEDCHGTADFTIIWQQHADKWQITRVLSYGHRPTQAGSNE